MLDVKKGEIANMINDLSKRNRDNVLSEKVLLLNTIATAERAIVALENLKDGVKSKSGKMSINEMLVLSVEFEMLYKSINEIKREHHL